MWSQQQSDWALGPLLLQLSVLSSQTNCCCQVNEKPQHHQSCSQKPSLTLWFWLLVYKPFNGSAALRSDKNSADLFGQQRLASHTSPQLWMKESLAYTQHLAGHTPTFNFHLTYLYSSTCITHCSYSLKLFMSLLAKQSEFSLDFSSCLFKSWNSKTQKTSERPITSMLQYQWNK